MSAAGQANWPHGTFGNPIAHVRTIVAHLTAGWPRRDNANTFVARYIVPGTAKRGLGPQAYISGDGTVAKLIDLSAAMLRRTGHGEWVNDWAIGVETGNLGDVAAPPEPNWVAANGDAENIPGAKLWITSRRPVQTEVLPGWWTTAAFSGPQREAVGADHMLFSEQAMQAWALLARYLMAEFGVPRNFPLLPHVRRSTMMNAAGDFRRMVVADERADMLMRAVAGPPIGIPTGSFNAANAATLQTQYGRAIQAEVAQQQHLPAVPGAIQRNNRAWRAFCATFRGLHGHGFSGSLFFDPPTPAGQPPGGARHHEHDCPGPLFDFHRLAREVSDYWWYPFDVAAGRTNVDRRPYRRFQGDTPIIEYWWDESEAEHTTRIGEGIHGAPSSPDTFLLDRASPIYAMSNGELVAARFPQPGAGVSMAFTLVRHEVYHAQASQSLFSFVMPRTLGAIDYQVAPESVYTLYMHLGRAANVSFADVNSDNPDWLNRLLIRKKECELGVAFYDDDPTHHHIAAAVWNNRPPGVPARRTTLEGWRHDHDALNDFFVTLSTGNVASLSRSNLTVPARVLLGDFLGESGVVRVQGGTTQHGIRVETFAPSFRAPTFTPFPSTAGWTSLPAIAAPYAQAYASEWHRALTQAEENALAALGVNLDQRFWWGDVAIAQFLDGSLPAAERVPNSGMVFHYRPLEFANWLNGVTWASEWPKFEVTDAAGAAVPRPARPKPRRV